MQKSLKQSFDFAPGSVQETMLLCLMDRARFVSKFPWVLKDQAAETALEQFSRDFGELVYRKSDMAGLTILCRSKTFDDTVAEFLASYPAPTVVNLACGMETNYFRIGEPQVPWYELDLPDAIDFRERFFQPSGDHRHLRADLMDFSWMDKIERKPDGGLLFVASGVFCFFSEAQLKALICEMSRRFPGAQLAFESYSKSVADGNSKFLKKRGFDAQLTFSSASIEKTVTGWDPRIRLVRRVPFYKRMRTETNLPLKVRGLMRIADMLGMMEIARFEFPSTE